MAYFLKKTNIKNDTYLQIYESFYDPERKGSAHRSYRPVGYVKKLMAEGIDDPNAHFQAEVDRLNQERSASKNAAKARQIKYCSEEIFRFPRDFRVAKISDRKYINLTRNSPFIKQLSLSTGLPLTLYFLSDGQIKKMLSHRF